MTTINNPIRKDVDGNTIMHYLGVANKQSETYNLSKIYNKLSFENGSSNILNIIVGANNISIDPYKTYVLEVDTDNFSISSSSDSSEFELIAITTMPNVIDAIDSFNTTITNISSKVDSNTTQLADIMYNVKSFGAKGDGINNDLNAINSAQLNTGGVIYLPKGIFLIDGNLSLTHSLIGCGHDTVVYLKNGRINCAANDIEISNLKIHSFMNNPINIYGIDTNNRRKNIRIYNLLIEHDSTVTSNFLAMDVYFSDNLNVYNNTFIKGGLQLVESLDFNIYNNHFDGLLLNDNELIHASTNSRGIINANTFLNMGSNEAIDIYTNGDRCVISNNRFENYYNHAIDVKVVLRDAPYTGGSSDQTGYSENTIISGNEIYNCIPQSQGDYYGIVCSWIDLRATPSLDIGKTSEGISISNNIINGMFLNNPLNLINVYCSGINIKGTNINVNNNIIRNIHGQGLNLWESGGIQLGDRQSNGMYAYGCNIEGNIINVEGSGISVFDARNCNIVNNIIKKDERNNLSPRYGIRISRNLENSNIINNNITVVITSGLCITNVANSTFKYNNVLNNIFLNGGLYLQSNLNHNNFNNNIFKSCSITIVGTSGNMGVQNTINSNKFNNTQSDYPIILDYQKGFLIIGNSFDTSYYGVLVQDVSNYGLIIANTSLNQAGSTFVRYINVVAGDLSTITESNNIKY